MSDIGDWGLGIGDCGVLRVERRELVVLNWEY